MTSSGLCISNIDYQQAYRLFCEIIDNGEKDVSKCVSVAAAFSREADTFMQKGEYEASLDLLLDVSDLVVKKRIGRPEIAKEIRLSTLKRVYAVSDRLIEKYSREKRVLNIAEMRLMKAAVVSKRSINEYALANKEILSALKLYMHTMWKIEGHKNSYLQYYYITENCFKTYGIFQRRCAAKRDDTSVSQLASSLASLQITNSCAHSYQRSLRNIAHCFDLAKTKFIETLGRSISKFLREQKFAEAVRICDTLIPIVSDEIFPGIKEFLEVNRNYCRVHVIIQKPQ